LRLSEARSTQDEALAAWRAAGGTEAVLVVADRQTEGRGRSGNDWAQPDRAMLASLALSLDWLAEETAVAPLVAGLSARRLAADTALSPVTLKWPNDIMLDDRKVGGVLVERRDGAIVVGCGLNLWWRHPVEGAGAIFGADPADEVVGPLAEGWATDLLDRFAAGPGAWGRDEYVDHCSTIGRDVTWVPGGRGRAESIDELGGLVVATPGGEVVLRAGAVAHVRLARFAPDD
jgi:BirA family transcriptional regulator, biotin operon repressor / biotin---[acetyl-CoA-carboxylase] ligase